MCCTSRMVRGRVEGAAGSACASGRSKPVLLQPRTMVVGPTRLRVCVCRDSCRWVAVAKMMP